MDRRLLSLDYLGPNREFLCVDSVEARHPRRSEAVNIHHGLGEGLWSFLWQIVPDAASDDPVIIFAGEFLAIG
jgi:hypothetical protein